MVKIWCGAVFYQMGMHVCMKSPWGQGGGGLLTGLLSHGFVWGFGVGFRVYGLVPSSASLPQGLLCLQPFQAQSLRLDGKTTTCSGLISRVRRIYALPYTEREREQKVSFHRNVDLSSCLTTTQ